MSKNTKNFGIPLITQVIKFIDRDSVQRTAKSNNSDRYVKVFKTYDHLITMLYVVLSGCNSLREISGIMLACANRINHLGIKHFPKRSTISDANKRRSSTIFQKIYFDLYAKYKKYLSDSKSNNKTFKNLLIVDSSTISLFSNILQGTGRNPINGKKKGGIKIHTMISAAEDVPCLVRFTSAKIHDHTFLQNLNLKPGSIVVFDRGYVDYQQYSKWCLDDIIFVTRMKSNTKYQTVEEYEISDDTDNGIIKDEKIEIKTKKETVYLRRIAYWDEKTKRTLIFLTNDFKRKAEEIAKIYKQRWQIELLFKRLKQNFPLKYFLGDNQNAIEIQIWASLIAQLILLLIKKMAEKAWAFSNLMSVIRFHLMTYIDLFRFLNKPDDSWEKLRNIADEQLALFTLT